MSQLYKVPKNDVEAIKKFDSYEDDNLAIKMIEFYQEQRDKDLLLEDAYLKTLQNYILQQGHLKLVTHGMDSQITLQ